MNSLKIGVILLGAALFAAACGDGSQNTGSVAGNKTASNSPRRFMSRIKMGSANYCPKQK